MVGQEQEVKIHDRIRELERSYRINNHSFIVFHNISRDSLKHPLLKRPPPKKELNKAKEEILSNEFDIVIIDLIYGVYIIETKSKPAEELEQSGDEKYSLKSERKKQMRRYRLLKEIREFCETDVPIHAILLCKTNKKTTIYQVIISLGKISSFLSIEAGG